ncbi:hypothetical protein ISE67_16240 [Pseudomonas aeruginosa]|uniref:hypothetical protein n=1 Tax=Pseudomonas aeruginosa TaxID=287 RepID=UPI0015F0EED2|nr:hypothetical protein [Pseudomonas aeruginosa]MBA5137394.1 hypothetical protein [Pseudomonas aeruginosa]MBX6032251.1 hypothetical protein [Pseudomonas aeruginosa]MDI3655774.1 hypothetical protein [Pseudomonas aeruginosa]MDI3734645.1 hypothetical protein [Pseudomonas aeruginosa]WHV77857.1 hypothetical protein M2I96_03095 [Pseudomonas aeruginosa]
MRADRDGTLAEQKRFALRWQDVNQRPECGNCRYLRTEKAPAANCPGAAVQAIHHCTLGGFQTTRTAICEQHKRAAS